MLAALGMAAGDGAATIAEEPPEHMEERYGWEYAFGTKAYPQDLRERIVRAVASGMPKAEAARTFQAALSTAKQYVARQEQTGQCRPGPVGAVRA